MSSLFLQTFGSPALLGPTGETVTGPRRKDLALLIFLCLAGKRTYSRAHLASLLWGDSSETRGRHSLTQTLGRLQRHVGESAIQIDRNWVQWQGQLRCDALQLEEAFRARSLWATDFYVRDFLEDFEAGDGTAEFGNWADERRARYRTMMVRVLDEMGAEAERSGRWSEALELAQRVVELEPIFEEGHRRLMRTWSALGERALALHHYQRLADWLKREMDESPDPVTQVLADDLRRTRSRAAKPEAGDRHGLDVTELEKRDLRGDEGGLRRMG